MTVTVRHVRPLLGRIPSRQVLVHAARGRMTLCGRIVRGWDSSEAPVSCRACLAALERGGQS